MGFERFFIYENIPLTSSIVANLFRYDLAATGSNLRTKQTRVIAFWRDFLLDLEGAGW